LPATVHAHKGPVDDIDECKIRVGYEWIHFTAYTPKFTGAREYCKNIPQLGPTNLVFDYEGKKLRHITVEFEVTKEPEGTRIFYQEPQMIKSGTVNGLVDFSQYGAGDYLAHVTIVHKNKRLDSHLSFKVGFEEKSYGRLINFLVSLFVVFVLIFIMIRKANKEDSESISS
jgi:hypothetical protein